MFVQLFMVIGFTEIDVFYWDHQNLQCLNDSADKVENTYEGMSTCQAKENALSP